MKRTLVTTATGAVAVLLLAISSAWACGPSAIIDMTLKNSGTVSWNNGSDVGQKYNNCPTIRILANTCGRDVTVTGENFVNESDVKDVTKVELYWLDEPFFATGAGRTHEDQQVLARVCRTKGVLLDANVAVSNKTFTTEVLVPPTDSTYNDGTPRLVRTYAGANAICAVWNHDVPNSGTHSAAIGNQYNIWP